MDFDITSMKQRAKALMRGTSPNPKLLGILFAVFYIVYEICIFSTVESAYYVWIFLAVEVIYLNFRVSSTLYGLKVAREEATSVSDAFLGFKKGAVKYFILSVLKDICYVIGICFCGIGVLVPFYWFRFSAYIIKDEEANPFQALGRSVILLRGHYRELIKLDITNIGWIALQMFTGGISGFYVKPYLAITYAEFYDYLKAQENLFS